MTLHKIHIHIAQKKKRDIHLRLVCKTNCVQSTILQNNKNSQPK